MKPRKNRVPDWFDLENYRRVQSWEEWAYSVWVREQYYRAGYPRENRAFFTHSLDGPNRGLCVNLREVPVSVELFTQYLCDNSSYWEHFCEIKRFWEAENDGSAVRNHVFEEMLPTRVISNLPEMIESEVALELVEDWVELEQPISINYGLSFEKIMSDLRKHVSQQQGRQAGLFVAGGVVDSMKKMNSGHIFNGGKLLALFDLLYWKTAYSSLTYAEVGEAIWPGEGLNIEQRIMKVGIPTMNQFFTRAVAKALFMEHVRILEADVLGKT